MADTSISALVKRLAPLFNAPRTSAERLDPGLIAELRRLDLHGLYGPKLSSRAFWIIAADVLDERLSKSGARRPEAEDRWALAINAMAILADLNQSKRGLGRALAEAGYSELRFQRLLGCPEDRLATELLSAARYLAAKGEAVNYFDLAALAVTHRPKKAEDVRRGIARDYFRTLAKQSKDKG